MNQRLKKIIFKKLYEDLKNVEIIPYKESIWFIDRENEYWYFEYEKDGTLWWRWLFFNNYFEIFSLENTEYELIMSDWVEEVLNCKVYTTDIRLLPTHDAVEEVLNCKVYTTVDGGHLDAGAVEEVLNCKVYTTRPGRVGASPWVEEVLNHKVNTVEMALGTPPAVIKDILNQEFVSE